LNTKPVVLSKEKDNYQRATTNFTLIYNLAKELGIKYPEIVAAQMGLESSWGLTPAADNNYWGLQATPGELKAGQAQVKSTKEFIKGKEGTYQKPFKDFSSIREALLQYKEEWDQNFMGRKGASNATTREEAIQILKDGGYATDPDYVQKILEILGNFKDIYMKEESSTISPATGLA